MRLRRSNTLSIWSNSILLSVNLHDLVQLLFLLVVILYRIWCLPSIQHSPLVFLNQLVNRLRILHLNSAVLASYFTDLSERQVVVRAIFVLIALERALWWRFLLRSSILLVHVVVLLLLL